MAEEIKDQKVEGGKTDAFDRSKALDDRGFLKFLTNFKGDTDPVEMEDSELELKFKVFKENKRVVEGIRTIIKEEVSKDFGFKLSDKDLSNIEKYVTDLSMESPERVLELAEQIKTFKELPEQIAKAEAEFAKLKASGEKANEKIAYMEARREKYALASMETPGFIGTFFSGKTKEKKDIEDAKWEMIKLHGRDFKPEDIKKQLDLINEQIENFKKIPGKIEEQERLIAESKAALDGIRVGLTGKIIEEMGMNTVLVTKIRASINTLIDSNAPGNNAGNLVRRTVEASEKLNKFKEVNNSGKWGELFTDDASVEEFEKSINTSVDNAVVEAMNKAIMGIKLNEDGQFSKLEKCFSDLLKGEQLGSFSKDEVKSKITNILEQAIASFGNTEEDISEKILISSLIRKINK